MTQTDAERLCDAARLKPLVCKVMLPLLTEDPRPSLPELAARLGVKLFTVQKRSARGWNRIRDYRNEEAERRREEAKARGEEPTLEGEDLAAVETGRAVWDALQGPPPSNPQPITPADPRGYETIYGKAVTEEDCIRVAGKAAVRRRVERETGGSSYGASSGWEDRVSRSG